MNIVFWLIVVLALILLWFIVSFVFIPLGRIVVKKWNKTLEILNKENQDEEGEKNE